MKSGKSTSMPAGMPFRKCYCHKCGERLNKNYVTRLIPPDSPDFKKHARIGTKRVAPIGDFEVTECNSYRCPNCGNVIDYYEQITIGKIQKKYKNKILHESTVDRDWAEFKAKTERNGKILKFLGMFLILSLLFLFYYFFGDNLK